MIDQADAENLLVIEDFDLNEPKTKQLDGILNKIVPESSKLLLVSDSHKENINLAGRNLPYATLSSAPDLGPLDLVQAGKIIFSIKGIEVLLEKLGNL